MAEARARPPSRKRSRRRGSGKKRTATAGARRDPVTPTIAARSPDIDVDQPLTPAEAAEMRANFQFLSRHRKSLRLKVNAAEDLLLNGAQPPTHRGRCAHLLAKVDLSAVQSALDRLDGPTAQFQLLAGVVRFSTDVGVLLLYLEALGGDVPRSEAAAAFGVAIQRIDFAEISTARMRRVLDLISTTFLGHERVQVLFGLLQSRSFRTAFDNASNELPPTLADLFLPLRAVHEVVFERQRNHFGEEMLERGVTHLLRAPDAILRSYPQPIRERLLESAVDHVTDPELVDHATTVLLGSLPDKSRSFSRLATKRSAELLRRHEDERAAKLLRRVQLAHTDYRLPGRWLDALGSPRLGRIARQTQPGVTASTGRLESAFWLDQQRPVWLRGGDASSADRFANEARLQSDANLPGVAPILLSGVGDGLPFVALPFVGAPLDGRGKSGPLNRQQALALAHHGVQLLNALAGCGVCLPDLEPTRFLTDGGSLLWLADFDGALETSPDEGRQAHGALAAKWCHELLQRLKRNERPGELGAALNRAATLVELRDLIAAAL